MSEREVDQALVERAQRGEKQAFDLLVTKYQRKLGRLLARYIRDPAEVEDVAQEAFIKAYRALPSFRGDSAFYTWLYRIGINTAKNYLVAQGRRAPTSTGFDSEEAETFEDGAVGWPDDDRGAAKAMSLGECLVGIEPACVAGLGVGECQPCIGHVQRDFGPGGANHALGILAAVRAED